MSECINSIRLVNPITNNRMLSIKVIYGKISFLSKAGLFLIMGSCIIINPAIPCGAKAITITKIIP